MATLLLTAVGTAIGGPLGGAIGALLGQQVDQAVIGTGNRRGPRLASLAVQTSRYGAEIPHVFGTMRVAGTVIWSTDLIESSATSSGGKGQPSVTRYSYAASFAVLLSARPVQAVGRIWADGNLLRGAAGDFKIATGFRLHLGAEDQPVDPLIASAVAADQAPAHRGCAYAVFEMLQLASYGNRIPSLTFELIADPAPVGIGAIAAALAPEVSSSIAQPLTGFAATGTVRDVLDTLALASGAAFAPVGAGVVMASDGVPTATVSDDGASAAKRVGTRTRSVAALDTVPRLVTLGYYDPARDYQTGLQQARRPGAGEKTQSVEIAAVIDAAAAKAMATAILARAQAARTKRVIATGLCALAITPGTWVNIVNDANVWLVSEALVEGFVVKLTLVPAAVPSVAVVTATSGQALAAPDLVVGATLLTIAELPPLDDAVLDAPRLTVIASGTGAGWRQAALLRSLDGGASWAAAGATAAPAVTGTVAAVVPGATTSALRDLTGQIDVTLARADMSLEDADDDRLDSGANLALVGDELLQFGSAQPLGGARWRLTRLLRGRRGTEAMIAATPGARFALVTADTAATLDLPLAALGSTVQIMATGVGDTGGPVLATAAITGASVLPPAPVHLTLNADRTTLAWIRRSRAGWRWLDAVDAPLAEESEAYQVTGAVSADTDAPQLALSGIAPGAILSVRQRGTHGLSPAVTITT